MRAAAGENNSNGEPKFFFPLPKYRSLYILEGREEKPLKTMIKVIREEKYGSKIPRKARFLFHSVYKIR